MGDMSVNVSLPSFGGQNEWFLTERLMFSCRIRVMDAGQNTNALKWMIPVAQPPESSSDRIQREIRQGQDSDSTLDQDFVAPALCHMPIEVVSVKLREHPQEERTPSSIVSGTEQRERCSKHSEAEWHNEGSFEGGRRPTKGRTGTTGEMIRQNIEQSEWIMRTERSISSIRKERIIIPCNASILKRRLPFYRRVSQF